LVFILIGITGYSAEGSASVIFFVLIYIFSNLAAFGVINLVSAITGRETINDYKGFYKNNRSLSWVLAIALFSLGGIPPTAGFFGKFFLLLAGAGQGKLFTHYYCCLEHGYLIVLLFKSDQGDLYGCK
jgi:NADH-quinone oxidoreductase subunit N